MGNAHAPCGEATTRRGERARRVETNTKAPSSPYVASPGCRPTFGDFQPLEELVDDQRLAMRRRFLATVPFGAAVETMAASNLCAPTRPMARPHFGERKDALDTVA